MSNRTFLFLVNPDAGAGAPRRVRSRIRQRFDVTEGPSRMVCTESRSDARERAEAAEEHGFTHVVAVGGDGTVHAIVNGLVGTSTGLGVVPAGSGNDFARAIGIPERVDDALGLLEPGTQRAVDLGRLGDQVFVNGMGVGMDGAIARRFHEMSGGAGGRGYVLAAVRELFRFRGFHVRVELPQRQFSGRALFVSMSNGPVQGGGFRLGPDASLTDGLLDVHVARNVSALRRVINLPRWWAGGQNRLPDVEVHQSPSIHLRLERSVPCHMDGEPFQLSAGGHRIAVENGAQNVIAEADDS